MDRPASRSAFAAAGDFARHASRRYGGAGPCWQNMLHCQRRAARQLTRYPPALQLGPLPQRPAPPAGLHRRTSFPRAALLRGTGPGDGRWVPVSLAPGRNRLTPRPWAASFAPVPAQRRADAGEDVVLEDVVRLHAGLVGTAPPPTVTRSPPQEWISKEHVLRSPYGSSDGTAAALRAEAGSLPGFILSRADRWPDRTALVDSDSGSSITYAQLSTTTLRVAAGLSAAGFAAGDVFAVFAPSTLELPILLYAALRAGGCVTVCDPHFAVQDLANQLSDTAAKFLLTVPEMAEQAVDAAQLVGAQVQRVYVIGREPVLDCTPFSELLCVRAACRAWPVGSV